MKTEKKPYSTASSSAPSSTPSKSPKPPLYPKSTPKSKRPTNPFATQTPDQPSSASRRLRNRNVALSLTEVKKAAATTSVPPQQPNDSAAKSTRRRLLSPPDSPSPSVSKQAGSNGDKAATKLPEKYEMLIEFFNCLDSSIRLLRTKRSSSTFPNIFRIIESLTSRRFSHRNLAQLKYILPEAIEIKKVMNLDERTSCMKPDLHVSINADAIEFDEGTKSSKGLSLRNVFRKRLEKFCESHPEGDEVPEEMLPEPFNYVKSDMVLEKPRCDPSAVVNGGDSENEALEMVRPAAASHHSSSFRRSFSKKGNLGGKLVENASFPQPVLPVASDGETGSPAQSPAKVKEEDTSSLQSTPVKEEDTSSLQSTPAKIVLSPTKLMSVTPAQCKQKRSLATMTAPDGGANSQPNKLVRRLADNYDDDLPESLLESIREKQRKADEEKDPAISQAKRRRKMIASSPKLFNTVHFLFQSINRSVITKEELIHKIIAGQSDIADRRETEERLNLLEELLPEWISEKKALSGDLLCCINKTASVEAMRERLKTAI
ncbi:CDT1-like protein a, chloroplastic [Linum grandiflorum]